MKYLSPLLLFFLVPFSSSSQDSVPGHLTLNQVDVTAKPKTKSLIFSSFEKRIHISLDNRHDKFDYVVTDLAKKPLFFQAAEFLHNDISTLAIHKIEGKVLPFDTTQLRLSLVIIQRNRILYTVPVNPGRIRKKRITLEISDVYIETGEFYVLYVADFLKPAVVTMITNRRRKSQLFSFTISNGIIRIAPNTFGKQWQHTFPAPQFKISATEM